MRDPTELEERMLKGDTVSKDRVFAPHHCEECGLPAKEYFRTQFMTVCKKCVRPSDGLSIRNKK